MKLFGLQKLTLLDFPGKSACTMFTGGCNLRCPFCHNAMLVTKIDNSNIYTQDEIYQFLSKRKGLLDGVAITGGEPLLQPDIATFIKGIKDMGFSVKLDTNGTFPEKLSELLSEKLVDYVAMDIKNSEEKYAKTVGIENFDTGNIKRSIEILKNSDVDFEFRTTVVKEFHTVEDIEKIGKLIFGVKKYFLQNFEDSGNLIGENMHPVEKNILEKMKEKAEKYVEKVEIRGV